ncbi:MAG: CRISPR-associated protein Cas5 [Candidatus Woesearchaeota archaeon]
MWGLKFTLEGLYFTSFRRPTSTSIIMTYPVPPYTTIRGLLSNVLGLNRDDYRIQEWFKIGIKPLDVSNKSREMAKLLKLKGSGKKYQKGFPSSPLFREFLIKPEYEIFLVGDENNINSIYNYLINPVRPLYLGSSDDLVDIEVGEPIQVSMDESTEISSVLGGVYENSIIEKLPYKFHKKGKNFILEYKTISIPKSDKLNLSEPITCLNYNNELVWVT